MDMIHTRSKRRCTLYPHKQQKEKHGTSKTNSVEIVKHFESDSEAASQRQTELPFFPIEEEDEDAEVVSANIQFQPSRYTKQQTFTKKESKRSIEDIISSVTNPAKVNAIIAYPNRLESPEKFSSEIPCKRIQHKKEKPIIMKPTNRRRSSSLASSSSNPSSAKSSKKIQPLKFKCPKNPAKQDNIVNLQQDVSKLTTKLNAIENEINVNLRNKLEKNNDHRVVSNGNNQNQPISASIKPGYAIVTQSYIQNLKDEIHSARSKPACEMVKTANQLKAEIQEFRNSKNLPPTNIHSTNTNVKITLPKNKFPNTLDLKITNSIHGESYLNNQTEYSSYTPALIATKEVEQIINVPLNFEKQVTKFPAKEPTNGEILNKCLLPVENQDKNTSPFQINKFFEYKEIIETPIIQPQFGNNVPSQNNIRKEEIASSIGFSELVFPITYEKEDEIKTVVRALESEFLMSITVPPEEENENKENCPCKIDEVSNQPVPVIVEKIIVSSKVENNRATEKTVSETPLKINEEIVKIDEGDSPILPIIMNAVYSSLSTTTSSTRTNSQQCCERPKSTQTVPANDFLEEQKRCINMMQKQRENMQMFCDLLGEARIAMLDAYKNFKVPPSNEEVKINKNLKQLGSVKELPNNEQISNNENKIQGSIKAEVHLSCVDECTQINCGTNVDKKETVSATNEAESNHVVSINAQKVDQVNLNEDEEVHSRDSTENLDEMPGLNTKKELTPHSIERDILVVDYLDSISEETEKSVSFNEASIDISDKYEENLAKSTETKIESVKEVKPLKDRATEVVISSIISSASQRKQDPSQENEKVEPTNDPTPILDISLKSKLSIQLMPAIDIRRGLVTQTIPTIVITPSESTPQNIQQDSNVAYEIVKHLSDESIKKTIQPLTSSGRIKKDSPNLPDADERISVKELNKLQTDKCIQTEIKNLNKSKKEQKSDNVVKKIDKINEKGSYHSIELKKRLEMHLPVDASASENSSDPTCNIIFEKTHTKVVPPRDVKTSVEAVVNLNMPVTTFINKCFPEESESEVLLQQQSIGTANTATGSARKSTIADYVGKKECVKEFLNEMMKNPNTEVIFKSYQVVQEQPEHDPQQQLDPTTLSLIDTDIYKTYVNPEGLHGDIHSDIAGRSTEDNKSGSDKYFTSPTSIPREFYLTKGVQCGESVENVPPEDTIIEEKMIEKKTVDEKTTKEETVDQKTSEKGNEEEKLISNEELDVDSSENSSQNTTILNFDDVSQASYVTKNYDTETLLSYKQDDNNTTKFDGREIVQDPAYISRNSYELPHSLSPRLSSANKHSRASIPLDVQKGFAGFFSTKRSSHQRRPSQTSPMLELMGGSLQKKSLHSSHSLPAINLSSDAIERTSISSNSTEHVILEINRDKLRSKTYAIGLDSRKTSEADNLMESAHGGTEPDRSNSIETSDFVITHDISLQTSLTEVSEELLNMREYSKQHLETNIEKLKIIVEEDIRDEANALNVSCWTRFRNKNIPKDVYLKSTEPQDNTSIISEQKSVKLDVPSDRSYKSRPMTLSVPARVLRRLSRRGVTPVESFIEGLTSHNKNEILLAKNIQPRNELSVLEKYDSAQIVNAIKQATENWNGTRNNVNRDTERSSDTSTENMNIIRLSEIAENLVPTENADTETIRTRGSETSDISNVEVYTIMPVNVAQPEDIQIQEEFRKKPNEKPPQFQRNQPGGDEAHHSETFGLGNNLQFRSPSRTRHKGIFPRYKSKQKQKLYESSSSSEATTTLESISEKTDGNLSEGEITCNCGASIGEIHVCPYGKNTKTLQHLKKNPQKLLKREFGSTDVKIKWQKEFNSNWVAYYVSRSPSPDNTDSVSVDKSSTDSNGLVRK